ncbi:MAG TPA: DUF4214 domain-containing protein [Azospirillaceae bacterium]|nr:DUF4214 domain-containing protein [Azospirillaceae bacterium]
MTTHTAAIQKAYIAFFNRPADPLGLAWWEKQVADNGGNLAAVINAFSASQEYRDLYAGLNNAQIVNQLYNNLFGRDAEKAGLEFWVDALSRGTVNVGNIAFTMANGAQGDDAKVMANKVEVAQAFTAEVDTTPEILGYAGAAAAQVAREFLATVGATEASRDAAKAVVATQVAATVAAGGNGGTPGQTFTLTDKVGEQVTGTANNDTIKAVLGGAGATLNTGDVVDGGGGTDTLEIIATAKVLPAGFETKSVENIVVTNLTGGFDVTDKLGVAAFDGAKTITLASNVVDGATVTGLAEGQTFGLKGTSAVNSTTKADVTAEYAATAKVASVSLNNASLEAGATDGTLTVDGAALETLNVAGSSKVTGGTADTIEILEGAAVKTVKTINVTANAALALDVDNFTAATKVNVTGPGKANLNILGAAVKTLTATAAAGGVTATGSAALQEVTTGAGKDSITLGAALADKGFVRLGLGDDKLNIASNAVAKGAVIELGDGNDSIVGTGAVNVDAVVDGGAGTDTLAVALVNVSNGAAFKNFENVDLVGLGGRTFDAELIGSSNTIGKLVLSGNSGSVNAAIENVAKGIGLDITGSDAHGLTVVQKGASAADSKTDTFTVTFAGADAAAASTITAASLTLNGIETVNIVSGGGKNISNELTALVSDKAEKLVVTGDKALTVTKVYKTGTMESDVLKEVDASGMTGALKLDLAATNSQLTVKLGGGDDVITATVDSGTGTSPSAASAPDKLIGFNKATAEELAAGKGYDLVFVDDIAGVGYAVAANAAGTTTDVKITDGVVSFSTLLAAPGSLSDAIAEINSDVTLGNAVVFQYGANSYLFVQNGTQDLVVELTGLTGITKLGEVGTDQFYVM